MPRPTTMYPPTRHPPRRPFKFSGPAIGGLPVTPFAIPYSWLAPQLRRRHDKPIVTAQVTQTLGTSTGTTAYKQDAGALAEYGDNPFTATLNTACSSDPANLAAWILTYYATQAGDFPRARFTSLKLCLSKRTVAEQQSIHENVQIGRRILITDAPTTWPTGAVHQLVEGRHDIISETRDLEILTSPLIGATHTAAGPWFRADSSTAGGSDYVPY